MKKRAQTVKLMPMSHLLVRVTAPFLKGNNALWAHLCLNWDAIVGEVWGTHTCPTRLTFPTERQPKGVLSVSTWGGDGLALMYASPYLCEKVNQYFGYAAVHTIKWRTVKAPVLPQKGSSIPPPLTPLETEEHQWLDDHTRDISHPELQGALMALGEALVFKQKQHNERF